MAGTGFLRSFFAVLDAEILEGQKVSTAAAVVLCRTNPEILRVLAL